MKKLLATVVLLCSCLTMTAQDNGGVIFPGTMFASFDLGAYGYGHNGVSQFGAPMVGATGGFWLSDPLALELSGNGIMGTRANGNSAAFLFANVDAKWDVNYTFFHVYNRNYLTPIPVYPIFGMGVATCLDFDSASDSDYAFQISLGLQAPYRINDHTDAILQYRCYILPQGFDDSRGDNFMHTFGVGLLFRQSKDPYHRRTQRSSRSTGEDWFFGAGIGANYSAFDIFTNPNLGGTTMIGVAPEVMIGRNFSNFWTLRLQLAGLSAHEIYDTVFQQPGKSYHYSYAHADVMFNVTSLFWHRRGVRFNIIPYGGIGPVWRYDHPTFTLGADAGLFLRYYLNSKSDIYLDARYLMVQPSVGGSRGPSGKFYGVGLPSVTVGYIYNFGENTTRYRIPLSEVR